MRITQKMIVMNIRYIERSESMELKTLILALLKSVMIPHLIKERTIGYVFMDVITQNMDTIKRPDLTISFIPAF